jgi:hypothetical protein
VTIKPALQNILKRNPTGTGGKKKHQKHESSRKNKLYEGIAKQ